MGIWFPGNVGKILEELDRIEVNFMPASVSPGLPSAHLSPRETFRRHAAREVSFSMAI